MDVIELMNRDKFAANAGCKITEVDANHAVAEMTVIVVVKILVIKTVVSRASKCCEQDTFLPHI